MGALLFGGGGGDGHAFIKLKFRHVKHFMIVLPRAGVDRQETGPAATRRSASPECCCRLWQPLRNYV